MTDKTLTVDTDEKRKEWIELLEVAVDYHNEVAEELAEQDDVRMPHPSFHTGIARAILEAIWLIQTWEVKEVDPYAAVVDSISQDENLVEVSKELVTKAKEIENESTPNSDD